MADLEKMEDFKKQYADFLKDEIDKYCNEYGCYEIYWDYRDEINADLMNTAYLVCQNNHDGYGSVKDWLTEKICEMNIDYDDYFFEEVGRDLEDTDFWEDDDFQKWYDEANLIDDLYECGYNGVDVNLSELLRMSKFKIDIMFATDNEANYDMGSIINAYGSWREPAFDIESYDNALTYLIYQQGYTVDDYFCGWLNDETGGKNPNFIESVVRECKENGAEYMSELTALVALDGNEMCEFLDYLLGYQKAPTYLRLSYNTVMGIFNEWIGTGGLFDIQLEDNLIIPFEMISHILIEDGSDKYTVADVYGVYDGWEDCVLSYTEVPPEFPRLYMREDLFKETIEKFQKMYEKQNA